MSGVAVLTLVHTAISLVGIASGLGVLALMLEGRDIITQLAVLAVFVVLGLRASRRTRTATLSPRPAV